MLESDDSPSEAKYAVRYHSAGLALFPTRSRQPALLGFQCDCDSTHRATCGHLNSASSGRACGQLRFAVVGRCLLRNHGIVRGGGKDDRPCHASRLNPRCYAPLGNRSAVDLLQAAFSAAGQLGGPGRGDH